jgi:DNA-binding transcriptional regulator YhcF (GntR family)
MEFSESQAIYEQVADHVCEMILRGVWPEGDRIPSVRELAMELQVNPNTVNKGYSVLQDREIIQNQRGIGYFVSEGAAERTRNEKRHEFLTEELPNVFRTMELLDMGFDEFSREWDRYHNGATGGEK